MNRHMLSYVGFSESEISQINRETALSGTATESRGPERYVKSTGLVRAENIAEMVRATGNSDDLTWDACTRLYDAGYRLVPGRAAA